MSVIRSLAVVLVTAAALVVAPTVASADTNPTGTATVNNWPFD
ncbi:MAG TPA: hypothetical protein VGX25_00420 [Actinophytocola sp.]|nr:hypothetical protein [Actinophytocola sp.]HEV2777842.1 hypothetical protein [Actinophytocola sp.]